LAAVAATGAAMASREMSEFDQEPATQVRAKELRLQAYSVAVVVVPVKSLEVLHRLTTLTMITVLVDEAEVVVTQPSAVAEAYV